MRENNGMSVKNQIAERHSVIPSELKQSLDNVPEDQKHSHRMKLICHYAALGFKTKEIAIQLDLTPARVSAVLNSESGKFLVDKIQHKMFFDEPSKIFKNELPSAFRKVQRVLRKKDTKDSDVLKAADMVFDRALGKAVQEIKSEGSEVRQLIEMLDREMKAKSNSVTPSENTDIINAEFKEVKDDEPQKDDIDRYLDENFK